MNKRLGIVIIFALVVSALASTVVYRIISAKMGLAPKTASLLVAARDLPVGTLISAADVRTVAWSGYVPPRSLRNADEVVGRGVLEAVYEGDPMLENRLAARGAGGGLAATIPRGMRAAAVRVDEVVGVSGFVVPGMKVDVLVSGTPPLANAAELPDKFSKIVLQNIAVLSAGQNMQKDSEGKPVTVQVVNLLVTPEQAEILSLATNETKVQLVLRNPLDMADAKTNGTSLAALFSGGVVKAPAAPPVRRVPRLDLTARAVPFLPVLPIVQTHVVEVLHGGERASARFNTVEQE
jgi:pilus assembly protein CpaB